MAVSVNYGSNSAEMKAMTFSQFQTLSDEMFVSKYRNVSISYSAKTISKEQYNILIKRYSYIMSNKYQTRIDAGYPEKDMLAETGGPEYDRLHPDIKNNNVLGLPALLALGAGVLVLFLIISD